MLGRIVVSVEAYQTSNLNYRRGFYFRLFYNAYFSEKVVTCVESGQVSVWSESGDRCKDWEAGCGVKVMRGIALMLNECFFVSS